MTEVLLEQLNSQDIQWLKQQGNQRSLAAGKVLISPNTPVDFLYIVIEGNLAATVTKNQNTGLGRAFAALEDETALEEEIAHFGGGEILGEMSFLDIEPSNSVKAIADSVVLAIPRQALKAKLEQDDAFGARFFRAISILLQERFNRILQVYLKRKLGEIAPLQDVPTLFGELNDSDVDWMLREGQLQAIAPDVVLIRQSVQVENLYVIIDGIMSITVTEAKRNRLSSAFAALEGDSGAPVELDLGRRIGKTTRGEIVGEAAAFSSPLANYSLTTLDNSLVLTISRDKLLLKLQQDQGMANRFYRVVAILLSGRVQGLISRLGYGKSSYQVGQQLSQNVVYEDEIDLDVMDKLTLGGARFNWMLRRLKVS